jgi:hypothetical protein
MRVYSDKNNDEYSKNHLPFLGSHSIIVGQNKLYKWGFLQLEDEEWNVCVTSCENCFQLAVGIPEQNKPKFCPYCGLPLRVNKSEDTNDTSQEETQPEPDPHA